MIQVNCITNFKLKDLKIMDVMSKLNEIGKLYKKKEFEECLNKVTIFWNLIPEPKEKIQNSYLVIEYGARIALLLKKYDEALDWAYRSLKYNDIINRMGEGEFLIGIVAFEKKDLRLAKENFKIAFSKSDGKVFEGEDERYYNLIK